MKKILCFGDSNTYGFNPENGKRYPSSKRWSGILKESLKEKFVVVEQGCNNRTCFSDNPSGEEMTGYKAIIKYLSSDIDYLVISLGINDLQKFYNVNETMVVDGFRKFINLCYSINNDLKILVLSPSVINQNILNSYFGLMFDENSVKKSYLLSDLLKSVSIELNCDFIDLNEHVEACNIDGLHYFDYQHKEVAKLLHNYFVNLT